MYANYDHRLNIYQDYILVVVLFHAKTVCTDVIGYNLREISMADEYVQFGKRLEDVLIAQDVTRRQVAEDTGCTGATVGRWIRGEAPFSIFVLAKLHRKYDIDLNKLICGE